MLITKTQPVELKEYSHLELSEVLEKKEDQLVCYLDHQSPLELIFAFSTGDKPLSNEEVEEIEEVMSTYKLTPGVTNILVYYKWLRDPNSSLSDMAEYISLKGIERTRDALNIVKEQHIKSKK